MRRLLLIPLLAVAALAQPARVGAGAARPAPLDSLVEALGGADRIRSLETLRIESRTEATFGGTRATVRSTLDLDLRVPVTARWTVRLPGETRVTWVDEVRAATLVGDSVRTLPPAARAQVESALWLHPLTLLARRADLTADVLADDLIRIFVRGRREPLTVGLDADGRPSRITTFRRREGRRDYVEVVLRDYREVDGVFIPHRIRQAVRGVVTGEQTVRSVRFGVDLTGVPFGDAAD